MALFRCSLKTQGQESLGELRMENRVVALLHSCSAQECIWLDTGYYVKLMLCGLIKSNLLAIQRNVAAAAVCV